MFEKLLVLCVFGLMSFLPGAFVRGPLQSLSAIGKTASILSLSLSFWMLFVWFASSLSIPLTPTFTILLVGLFGLYLYLNRGRIVPGIVSFVSGLKTKDASWYLLGIVMLYLLFPFFIMTIPPGNDISMHGYIARLIINNNGLPLTYEPFLHDSPFGSYSAGFQALASLISNVDPLLLKESINLLSVAVFIYLLLVLIFLFSYVFKESVAIYSAVLTVLIAGSILTTIGWGGTPTVLAIAFCIAFFATVLFASRYKKQSLFLLSSLYLAAIPMTHAIPAVTFVYFCPVFFVWLWVAYKDQRPWLILQIVLMGVLAILLLLPFLIGFKNDSSPELSLVIRAWQDNMMGESLSDSFGANVLACLGQIKYRAGDPLIILFYVSLFAMLLKKDLRPKAYLILIFLAYLYLLVLNSAYWVLPLSEILYPERVMYFIILLLGIPLGYFLTTISDSVEFFKGKQQIVYVTVIVLLMGVGISRSWNGYILSIIRNNQVKCDTPTMEAYNWIEHHTPADAVFRCTYADAGIWIPAFANRATLGAHIHFIHEISHKNDLHEKSPAPKYLFVTQNDELKQTDIINWAKSKKLVFENEAIKIYQ